MPAGVARRLLGFHAVREALRASTPLRFIAVADVRQDRRVAELVQMARAARVAVRFEPVAALDRWANGAKHHGVVAEAEVKPVVELETLLDSAPNRLLLALDGWEDPQNLGAAVRAACGAGADGILLPSRRSVGLTESVERVSAGALEHVAVARVGNLVQALERCRQRGWWIVGLDAGASAPVWTLDLGLPTVIVVGAEGSGLHELTRKRCDVLTSIPLAPGVESLNAAMAAAIVLFETARQRAQAQLQTPVEAPPPA